MDSDPVERSELSVNLIALTDAMVSSASEVMGADGRFGPPGRYGQTEPKCHNDTPLGH